MSGEEWSKLAKAREFARWIGRSESLLRNVENRIVPLSNNLARRISERTGVSEAWLLSAPQDLEMIPDRNGNPWDPVRILDPLVLGDHDFRKATTMVPHLVLQLALAIMEVHCGRALKKGDDTPVVRIMDMIKKEVDLHDPEILSAVENKLEVVHHAEALQLWKLTKLAGSPIAVEKRSTHGKMA